MRPKPIRPRLRAINTACIVGSVAAGSITLSVGGSVMRSQFTLEFWQDGGFLVGRLVEVPGVFSQGETMEELRENIQDAYDVMVTQARSPAPAAAQKQQMELE